jgi:outer membrane protein OmpA-like peptidoglycan-associated protein
MTPARRRPPRHALWLGVTTAALLSACAATTEPAPPEPTPPAVVAAAPEPAPAPGAVPDTQAQFRELQQSLASAAVSVEALADGRIRISVPSDLSFALGQAAPQPAMAPLLDQIAASLNRFPSKRAEIVGHTDTSGRPASNLALSLRRAESTREQLVARQVAAERLSVRGVGQDEPVADNRTREGRSANRRVEIFVSAP